MFSPARIIHCGYRIRQPARWAGMARTTAFGGVAITMNWAAQVLLKRLLIAGCDRYCEKGKIFLGF
jgi:hypothetical protein